MVHEAVARLYEGDAVAPSIRVVVIAIGDAVAQFNGFVSPLARLVDWLSFRYGALFILSAGNHLDDLELARDINVDDPSEVQHEALSCLQRTAGLRRILSPAESANGLTVGAAHADRSSVPCPDGLVEPMIDAALPNVVSAHGPGIRRAIKPDFLLAGGRQLLRFEPRVDEEPQRATIPPTRRPPGLRFASPAATPGGLNATAHGTGTSLATALCGYHAGHLLDILDGLRQLYGNAIPGPEFDAVLTKAALVHQASWGRARVPLEDAQRDVLGRVDREALARLIGYGEADPAQALRCDTHRVTGLAAAAIAVDEAHRYRFPLPPSLGSTTAQRTLTLTLAWLTPINPEHRAYRRAAMTVEPVGPRLATDRTDVASYPSRRGTVQHERLTGRAAIPFASGAALELVVSCRADAGALESQVPYAVIATLEVPEQLELPIYEEVRAAMRIPVVVTP